MATSGTFRALLAGTPGTFCQGGCGYSMLAPPLAAKLDSEDVSFHAISGKYPSALDKLGELPPPAEAALTFVKLCPPDRYHLRQPCRERNCETLLGNRRTLIASGGSGVSGSSDPGDPLSVGLLSEILNGHGVSWRNIRFALAISKNENLRQVFIDDVLRRSKYVRRIRVDNGRSRGEGSGPLNICIGLQLCVLIHARVVPVSSCGSLAGN
jgi:hypothetical protein